MQTLAIYDWGIGGLGLYKAVKNLDPAQRVLYFSDAGFEPYGKVLPSDLANRVRAVLDYLTDEGVDKIAVACNAASVALEDNCSVPVENILQAGIREALQFPGSRIGVLGGKATITSGRIQEALKANGKVPVAVVAQELSAFVEAGDLKSEVMLTALHRILLQVMHCDAVLLACTHYPALIPFIRQLIPETVRLIDPAEAMAAAILDKGESDSGQDHFLTTGDPIQMRDAAGVAFGVQLNGIKRINL